MLIQSFRKPISSWRSLPLHSHVGYRHQVHIRGSFAISSRVIHLSSRTTRTSSRVLRLGSRTTRSSSRVLRLGSRTTRSSARVLRLRCLESYIPKSYFSLLGDKISPSAPNGSRFDQSSPLTHPTQYPNNCFYGFFVGF